MNKKIYLSALVALSLFACNQAEEPRAAVVPEGTFELNLTATVSDDAMRALSFNGLEDLSETPKISASSDFTTHAFFRRAGSDEVGYATIHWTAQLVDGRVKLIRPNTKITLENMTDQTIDEHEEWYVAGIAGGGQLNAGKTGVTFQAEEPVLESNQLRAPLTFAWTRIRKNEMVRVTFQPRGVLLRTSVNNRMTRPIDKQVYEVHTNELDNRGEFDFSAASSPISSLEAGNPEPVWRFTEGSAGVATDATLRFTAVNHPELAKRSYLVWGMSRQLAGGQLTKVGTTSKTTDIFRSGRLYSFESNIAMKNRESYTIDIDVDVQNPIDYIGPFLAADGTPATTNEQIHKFTISDLWPMIADKGYDGSQLDQPYVFDYWDAASVIAPLYHPNVRFWTADPVLNRREQLGIGGSAYIGNADFKSSTNVLYALRMKKADQGANPRRYELPDDSRRIACRWEYAPADGTLKLSIVRVGADPAITIDAISTPDWWDTQVDRTKSITFPAIGFRRVHTDGRIVEQNDKGFAFWARMAPGAPGAYSSFCTTGRVETLSSIQGTSTLSVLLFKKNDVSLNSYIPKE